MLFVAVRVAVLLALMAGVVVWQIHLSKKRNKWLGRILPIISFIAAPFLRWMITGISILHYSSWQAMLSILLCNIPTIIFLIIYWTCRESRKHTDDLAKMAAQDLQ